MRHEAGQPTCASSPLLGSQTLLQDSWPNNSFKQWQLDWKSECICLKQQVFSALPESKMKSSNSGHGVFFVELRCNNVCDVCYASARNRFLSSGDMSENAGWRDTVSMYHEEDTSPWMHIHGFHKERALWDCFLIETILCLCVPVLFPLIHCMWENALSYQSTCRMATKQCT